MSAAAMWAWILRAFLACFIANAVMFLVAARASRES
jgi:hypothetical protein